MSQAKIKALWLYPVKGMSGGPVEDLEITEQGIVGDREFTLVGEDGVLVCQKLTPQLASISAGVPVAGGLGLILHHKERGSYKHRIRTEGDLVAGTWVLDEFEGVDQGDEIAQWVSDIIGKKVRMIRADKPWLVNFPVPDMELVHGKPKQKFTAATDVSLVNLASLAKLNEDLDAPIGIERFRSNIIVDGIEAYEEDKMEFIGNGDVIIQQVTSAERCIIITTDQDTGERPDNNIFSTLAKTRKKTENRFGSGLLFGNYMKVEEGGSLYVGDRLQPASAKEELA